MLQAVSILCIGHAHGINFALTKCQKDRETMNQSLKRVWMEEFP